ncbi:beta-3-deoxy-D-manno-oct-2-ulosonic acid transferase [Sphingobium sp. AN641]|uniref:capsular polysaccharide export protein, LipB/KpsS family n=1 Tax=Sphingobium sp. AN641 TaxID=3133443 RepID=UPI0030C383C6
MSGKTRAPFLRSPPFPGVAPQHAAISEVCAGAISPDRISDALLDAIVQARVGGDFWGKTGKSVRAVVADEAFLSGLGETSDVAGSIGLLSGGLLRRSEKFRSSAIILLARETDPWALVEQAESVHAGPEADVAIVAGLLGKPVFGLDGERIPPAILRRSARSRIAAARYRDCFSGEPSAIEDAVAQLAEWRDVLERNRDIAAATGMAWWKRDAIARFLWDGRRSPPFLSEGRAIEKARMMGGAIAIWPSRVSGAIREKKSPQQVPVVHIEDGFLRSRGLGAAMHKSSSIVVDRAGIYYDARHESDLERLLATHDFSPALLERAQVLRERICATGASKYGATRGQTVDLPPGRRTVLAVGQVEDDLSVRFGGKGVTSNLDFLRRVREAEPDAWILYRPHPDVRAGHRKGHVSDAQALAYADRIDATAPLMDLIERIDAVHVLSSLTGFEALLRERSVIVHGMPFFAGWGLTRDLAPPPARRARLLTLDQLVAATLILYPRYLDPVTRLPCRPELIVERMATGAMSPSTWLTRVRVVQGTIRRLAILAAEKLHG